MRDIYGHVWYESQVEANMVFDSCLALFANVSYTSKKGRSRGLHESTRATLIPATLGVKYYLPISCSLFSPYIGIGGGVVWSRFRNHSDADCIAKNVRDSGAALLLKLGIQAPLSCGFLVDFFVDYSKNWVHFHSHRKDVKTNHPETGGLKTGVGIGYQF
jgi:outer membrane protein W